MAENPANIFSYPLVLSTSDQYLSCSLHRVSKARDLAQKLKNDGKLALINADRVLSVSQLVVAANQVCGRKNPTWDTVFQSGGSTHLGNVMRDYAFIGEEAPTEGEINQANVIIFLVGGKNEYSSLLSGYQIGEPLSMEPFFVQQSQKVQEFRTWYKLTQEEIEVSTLEQSVLTRVATKMFV